MSRNNALFLPILHMYPSMRVAMLVCFIVIVHGARFLARWQWPTFSGFPYANCRKFILSLHKLMDLYSLFLFYFIDGGKHYYIFMVISFEKESNPEFIIISYFKVHCTGRVNISLCYHSYFSDILLLLLFLFFLLKKTLRSLLSVLLWILLCISNLFTYQHCHFIIYIIVREYSYALLSYLIICIFPPIRTY